MVQELPVRAGRLMYDKQVVSDSLGRGRLLWGRLPKLHSPPAAIGCCAALIGRARPQSCVFRQRQEGASDGVRQAAH